MLNLNTPVDPDDLITSPKNHTPQAHEEWRKRKELELQIARFAFETNQSVIMTIGTTQVTFTPQNKSVKQECVLLKYGIAAIITLGTDEFLK